MTILLGDLPAVETEVFSTDWPDSSESVQRSLASLSQTSSSSFQVLKKERCYFPNEGTLHPVWNLILSINSLPYETWADSEHTYKVSRLFFDLSEDVQGKVQAYEANPKESKLQTFLIGLIGDGTLTSQFFTTDPSPSSSGVSRARSDTHEFIFSPDSEYFPEASVFAHVSSMYDYFASLGYTWEGGKPLTVRIHATINDTKNNALYQPSDGTSLQRPIIIIGDGDNIVFQNLAIDSDVVSHEFGHHVIFRTVKETTGESLILHEGLADYFTFSKHGDTCLGESICVPDADSGCYVAGQCLRTGDNPLVFQGDSYLKLDPHLKGQLISGFLLDLHSKIEPRTVTKTVFSSLDLLVKNSGIEHFLVSLMLMDYKQNAGNSACVIYESAIMRGFKPLLKNVDCADPQTLKASRDANTLTTEEKPEPQKKDPVKVRCGKIAGIASHQGEDFSLAILFLFFPLCVMAIAFGKKNFLRGPFLKKSSPPRLPPKNFRY
ncbi:MAG: hypothetical protein HYW48_04360 [Deltaproteobacteria bacterium]|nr:hypothetical protein [Deltaproteobacteria bacterium]